MPQKTLKLRIFGINLTLTGSFVGVLKTCQQDYSKMRAWSWMKC